MWVRQSPRRSGGSWRRSGNESSVWRLGTTRAMRSYPGSMSTTRAVVVGAVAAAAASWTKSLTEPVLQRTGERLFPPRPEQKALLGADVSGRPELMPPAVMIRNVARSVAGREIDDERSTELMPFVHYGFGVGFGVGYSLIALRRPAISMLMGVPAGALLWLATHGSTVPAAGLQASPASLPRSWYVWELGSHLIFGATLEMVRRAGWRALRRVT
ncbi:DUF1440 domain-containing protein [Ilumatobacter sp.]|uniref:DUF1440 domain-containing protein n=1 Tax=Ilumatobacter sp. TaxID=1967498 RepID=UPI003C73813D